jgi:ABC-type branched-subunit amino acid transport system substrate-binding protein
MKTASSRFSAGALARGPIALLAVLTTFTFAACGSAAAATTGSSSSGSNTITIGFDAEESGIDAAFGTSFLHGAETGVAYVNKTGVTVDGKKYKFKLDICNDNSDQTQVAACVVKLVTTDHDLFMFGGLADFGPIVRGITEPNRVIYFSTGSAVAALMSTSHYVVNTVPSLNARSLMSVRGFLKLYPHAKTVGLLGEQDATDQAAFAADELAFKQMGMKVVGTEIAPIDATDYSSYLTALKADHPDVIWNELAAAVNSEPEMLGQNGSLDASTIVFNNSGSCLTTYPHTPGVTYIAETNAGAIDTGALQNSGYKEYQKIYYGLPRGGISDPDPYIGGGLFIYDFFTILAKAIEKAGTFTSTKAVLKAMNGTTYNGVDGAITVNHNQATYGQVLCVAKNGNGAPSEFEVFPNGTSTGMSG